MTWIICGGVKFGANLVLHGHDAIRRIGLGGFPSNHTAVVSSLMWALMLVGEWHMAGLALAVLMICVLDATGLRREVGHQAKAINRLTGSQLREIVGHNPSDIVGGLVVGLVVAVAYWSTGAIP